MSTAAPLPQVKHTVIRASAGSGKTFRLAHHYIRLLSLGVDPDRILAVTFSRKAAGEIFDSIVGYLIEAAQSEESAAVIAERIEQPDYRQLNFQELLASFFQNLHRVRIGTLDSFYVTMLQLFAFELGVAPQSRLIDTGSEEMVDVQASILDGLSFDRKEDQSVLQDLEEAFKLATFGREDQRFRSLFLGFLKNYLQKYRAAPQPERWGTVDVIWPEGSPFAWEEGLEKLAGKLEASIPSASEKEDHQKYLMQLVDIARNSREGEPLGKDRSELVVRFLPWLHGETTAKLGRSKLSLNAAEADVVARIVQSLLAGALAHALQVTQGLHRLLDRYHDQYMSQIRHRGGLSFDDVLEVLAPAERDIEFSCEPGPDRLFIDFRMDGRIDHWLLDEFQDTSTPQFRVLQNLLDEVYQNADGSRSVFLVGDIKQAIYGWRAGEFGLMNRILATYGERIDLQPLDETRRSCRAVLSLVNQVFENPLSEETEFATATEAWSTVWKAHEPAGEIAEFDGYAAVVEPDSQGGEVKPTLEDQAALVNDILLTTRPWERGLSTVILAASNDELAEVASYLREFGPDGVSIRLQGSAHPRVEPVYNVLLSLLQWVLHPGDTSAEQHVRMSPLGGGSLHRRHEEFHDVLYEEGLYSFFHKFGKELAAASGEAGQKRWLDLLQFASEFMQDGEADLDAFVRLARARKRTESSAGDGIHLMTIHQSKGLGFDQVFLILKGSRATGMTTTRHAYLSRSEFGVNDPEWLLAKPDVPVLEADLTLKAAHQQARCVELYENLCKLYVATTRAKKALYVITAFPGRSSKSLSPANFLRQQLVGEMNPVRDAEIHFQGNPSVMVWESGRPDWFEACAPLPISSGTELQLPVELADRDSTVQMSRRRSPSSEAGEAEPASLLFANAVEESFRFGTAFHELMEQFQWREADFQTVSESWRKQGQWPEALCRSVIAEAEAALASPEWQEALSRPEGDVVLWLEAPFETMLNQEWVTGVFDRVVIVNDEHGRAQRAVIQDFKTNQGAEDEAVAQHVEHYRPQMDLYRQVLADMIQLDPASIACQLLFSKSGRVVAL